MTVIGMLDDDGHQFSAHNRSALMMTLRQGHSVSRDVSRDLMTLHYPAGPVTTIMSLNSTATMTRIFRSPHVSQYFSVTQYLSGPDCHGRRSNSKECSHCHVQITTAARDAGVGGDQGG